jgi:hypothetical protein
MEKDTRPIIPQGLSSGNYLYLKGEVVEIDALDVLVIKQALEKGQDHNYRAIPLDEEWLLKFKFEKNGFRDLQRDISPLTGIRKLLTFSGDYLFLRETKTIQEASDDNICVLWNKDIMNTFYVHEFQNLYYCLTQLPLTF